jgi:hypothetical protein
MDTRLRDALLTRYPWLAKPDLGPRSVEAGECDRCGGEARLIATCGPVPYREVGRRCTGELGSDAWCQGHADAAERALAWLAELPPEADEAARLWWVASGEVRISDELRGSARRLALPPP